MRKDLTSNQLFAGGILRGLGAASLVCCLALFGCTTDRMPGSGKPGTMGPGVGPAPASETPGSESGNVPMTSSYSRAAILQTLQPAPVNTDALAIAAADQGFRGRTLGFAPSDFGGTVNTTANAANNAPVIATGQFINPSMFANPAQTLNSSISSAGPFVNGELGPTGGIPADGIAAINTTGAAGSTTSTTATTGALTNGTTAATTAVIVTPNGVTTTTAMPNTLATPTNTALPLTVGQFAAGPGVQRVTVPSTLSPGQVVITNLPNGTLTPTVSSGALLTPTQAANPVVIVGGNGTSTTAGVTTTTARSAINGGVVTGPLVISRSTTGAVTISNISTIASPATVSHGHAAGK